MSNSLRTLVRAILKESFANAREFQHALNLAARKTYGNESVFTGKMESKRGAIRVQLGDFGKTLTSKQLMDLMKIAGHKVVEVVPPGTPNSKSGKFPTYVAETGIQVLFSGANNAGLSREKSLVSDIKQAIDTGVSTSHLDDLFRKLGLELSDLASVELASAKRVKRELNRVPTDVGEMISDVTLTKTDGTPVYISLKVTTGGGGLSLINVGCVGAFRVDSKSGTVAVAEHRHDWLLEAIGLSKKRIALGLRSILRGDPMKNVRDPNPQFDQEALRDYLSSAYGYGYMYVVESKRGWDVVDLTTLDKLREHVGDPTVEFVVYPGMSEKGNGTASQRARAAVSTSHGSRYEFVVRNTDGTGLSPTKILVDIK
jgi:hypothetical protein